MSAAKTTVHQISQIKESAGDVRVSIEKMRESLDHIFLDLDEAGQRCNHYVYVEASLAARAALDDLNLILREVQS